MSVLQLYKKGQGKYTRSLTFLGAMLLAVIGAYRLSEFLKDRVPTFVQFGVPTAVVIAIAALMFWVTNRPKSADFLIATEGEMKKVSWSSRAEVVGSTKVVIITTAILAILLFVVDVVFEAFFSFLRTKIG